MKKTYQIAQFLLSAPTRKQAPNDEGFEVAFAGRSNAGKSSALNTLTSQKSLARVSKTPGRTQLINFFELKDNRRLVDLPGYGFAKVNANMQREWQKNMADYVQNRQALKGLIILMDVRHPMTDIDYTMLEWGLHMGMPMHVLLTKSDKLKKNPAKNQFFKVQQQLQQLSDNITVQLFSSLKKEGLEQAWQTLDNWLDIEENDA